MSALHAVIIHKPIDISCAIRMAKDIIGSGTGIASRYGIEKTPYYVETDISYHFLNIPKLVFKGSFRFKNINKNMTLVFGTVRDIAFLI